MVVSWTCVLGGVVPLWRDFVGHVMGVALARPVLAAFLVGGSGHARVLCDLGMVGGASADRGP